MSAPIYIATAYRWGWYNNHNYLIYVGTDKAKATAMADAEAGDRGGKYGCVVCEYTEDAEGAMQSKEVAYFPSVYGETRVHHNYRIDFFKSLGHRFNDFADGMVMLPQEGTSVLKQTKVEPPAWVVAERDRELKTCDFFTAEREKRAPTSTRATDNVR